jgi:two-component system, response regulator
MTYGGVEVLLVEDDPDDVELTLHTLQDARISNPVAVARDGEEALDYVFRRGACAGREDVAPRLILLDLNLPKISGLDVLRQIKADPRMAGIPVVVLTSSGNERDLVEAYRLGANSYMQKPVDFVQLQKTIREMGYYLLMVNRAMHATG